jgi:hypothetical protein
MVQVVAPRCDQTAGMAQVVEQVFIQTFIPHSAVEAFDEAILHQFAGRDVMPINLAIFLPFQDRIRSQFGPIVADHHTGVSTHLGNPIQFTRNTVTRQRCIDDCSKTFAAEVVDHVQDAEAATT